MSIAARNTEIVGGVYAAFGRGDVPAILAVLDENVEWEWGLRANAVPYLQPRTGRADTGGFFKDLAENLAFAVFDVVSITAAEDGYVMALVHEEGKNIKTGKDVGVDDVVHIWKFDKDSGLVTSFRHMSDIHKHEEAARV